MQTSRENAATDLLLLIYNIDSNHVHRLAYRMPIIPLISDLSAAYQWTMASESDAQAGGAGVRSRTLRLRIERYQSED